MPNSDEKLSVLGYGCMRLPSPGGRQATMLSSIDKEKAADQIRYAIDKGVNYLDTAYPYHAGTSEGFLGEYVLKDGLRERVNLATKLPCMMINKKASIEEIFKKQLERLRTEYVDYYLLHSLNGDSWEKMLSFGIIDFMDAIRRQGRVRHMGFSFHGAREDFRKITDGYDWEFTLVQFNILDEQAQAGIDGIKYAHGKGLGVFVMEPLRGGSLAAKLPRAAEKVYEGAPEKRSPAEWALRWVWNHPEVTLLLSGMNDRAQIDENVRVASEAFPGSLSDGEKTVMEDFRKAYVGSMQVACTGCGYCMPCPAGINIPSAFSSLNSYHMSRKFEARMFYALGAGIQTRDGKPHWTKACSDCGQCEKKCPQELKIREGFALVRKALEGPGTRAFSMLARAFVGKKKKKSEKTT